VALDRAGKRIAILQSDYVPWKGYFDIIGLVDTFVVYDDVQYSKNHWHNRNLIKTQHGLKWITVPVSKTDGAFASIDSMAIASPFAARHWQSISQAYAHAPFMAETRGRLEALYRDAEACTLLSDLNLMFLRALASELGIRTEFVPSRDLVADGSKTGRLVAICRELGATTYLSGPSAKDYIDTQQFEDADIALEWMDYGGYPEYAQLHGPFEPGVSILDLILNLGPDAAGAMKFSGRLEV
jgi:hypothetical protein